MNLALIDREILLKSRILNLIPDLLRVSYRRVNLNLFTWVYM